MPQLHQPLLDRFRLLHQPLGRALLGPDAFDFLLAAHHAFIQLQPRAFQRWQDPRLPETPVVLPYATDGLWPPHWIPLCLAPEWPTVNAAAPHGTCRNDFYSTSPAYLTTSQNFLTRQQESVQLATRGETRCKPLNGTRYPPFTRYKEPALQYALGATQQTCRTEP